MQDACHWHSWYHDHIWSAVSFWGKVVHVVLESLATYSHLGMRVCGDLTYRNPVARIKPKTAPELFVLKGPGPSLAQL